MKKWKIKYIEHDGIWVINIKADTKTDAMTDFYINHPFADIKTIEEVSD